MLACVAIVSFASSLAEQQQQQQQKRKRSVQWSGAKSLPLAMTNGCGSKSHLFSTVCWFAHSTQ
jgi:hypothetical protein